MQRCYVTLDVFTRRRFAGNPLAVVLDGEGLDAVAMQAIAREFNLSETVFLLPPQDPAHRARYRIFTRRQELPFAGHPTVGTAVTLALRDDGARDMVLEAEIGPVHCRVAATDADGGEAKFALPALPVEAGPPPPTATLAAALGLGADDIGFADFAPACWSAGVALTFVPVKSLAALRRATPNLALFASALTTTAHKAVYAFCAETAEPGHDFHARMFAPAFGIVEDPATGAAAAAFAAMLARCAGFVDGEHAVVIEQGYEMGRPSIIHLGLTLSGGTLLAGSVGGGAVVVTQGTIET